MKISLDKYLSKQETAEILGVSERTIARYLKDGKLPGAILGKAWRIKETDVQEFFERMKVETPDTLKKFTRRRNGGESSD